MLADSRLPSGGHVSSSGLEPALMAGMARENVLGFLLARARTTAIVDAGTAVVTRHLILAGAPGEAPAASAEVSEALFTAVGRAWAARTPSKAARDVARELGRGMLRLATSLWPAATVFDSLDRMPPRPLVFGAVAAHAGLEPHSLVRLLIYDDAASAAAALLKLDPGDPAEAMHLVLEACRSAEPEVPGLAGLTSPHEIPAASAPQSEDWLERHALTTRRLFRA